MGLNCDVSPLPQAVLTILYMIASHANFYVFYIQKKKEKEKSNFLDVFSWPMALFWLNKMRHHSSKASFRVLTFI